MDDPKIVNHTYSSPGTYTAKVIAERGTTAEPDEARVGIVVSAPTSTDYLYFNFCTNYLHLYYRTNYLYFNDYTDYYTDYLCFNFCTNYLRLYYRTNYLYFNDYTDYYKYTL